jgi:hypothetical protein
MTPEALSEVEVSEISCSATGSQEGEMMSSASACISCSSAAAAAAAAASVASSSLQAYRVRRGGLLHERGRKRNGVRLTIGPAPGDGSTPQQFLNAL